MHELTESHKLTELLEAGTKWRSKAGGIVKNAGEEIRAIKYAQFLEIFSALEKIAGGLDEFKDWLYGLKGKTWKALTDHAQLSLLQGEKPIAASLRDQCVHLNKDNNTNHNNNNNNNINKQQQQQQQQQQRQHQDE